MLDLLSCNNLKTWRVRQRKPTCGTIAYSAETISRKWVLNRFEPCGYGLVSLCSWIDLLWIQEGDYFFWVEGGWLIGGVGRSGVFDVLWQRSSVWLCGFGPVLNPLAALEMSGWGGRAAGCRSRRCICVGGIGRAGCSSSGLVSPCEYQSMCRARLAGRQGSGRVSGTLFMILDQVAVSHSHVQGNN
jgi:hypothetical protein